MDNLANLRNFSVVFNKLCQKSGMKNVQLEENLGIRADKISKLRSGKTEVKPTVEDLLSISEYFNISIDELLGNKPKKEDKDNSMREIVESLFLIANIAEIKIEKQGEKSASSKNCLVFKNPHICDFLSEWSDAINMRSNLQSGKSLYATWRKGILEASEERLRKYEYMTEKEMADLLTDDLLSDYSDAYARYINDNKFYGDVESFMYLTGDWTRDKLQLIEKYYDRSSLLDMEADLGYALQSAWGLVYAREEEEKGVAIQ